MAKENDSIVLNVSEATGKIMEEIQDTITSSLFESLETIKKNVKDCNETCEDTKREISKLTQLDDRFSTVEANLKEIDEKIISLQNTQNILVEKMDLLIELNTPFWKRNKKKDEK